MANAFKAGKVIAPDSKFTGEEPDWHNWEKMPIETFMTQRVRMLRFYSYYLTAADLRPAILVYMKKHGYKKDEIDLVRTATPSSIPMTAGKLIRAIDMGMPSLHPEAREYMKSLPFLPEDYEPTVKDDHEIIKDELRSLINSLNETKDKVDEKSTTKKVSISPGERLRLKVEREVIVPLEKMLDDWLENYNQVKVEPLSLTSYIRDGAIPPAGCKYIAEWINRQLVELRGAFDKTDEQYIEGYSYLTRPALKNRIANLDGMLAEITKVTSVAKTMRKPRVKKTKDATKQVKNLKYQIDSKEYGIDSINPTRIPGAQTLFLFNTKYRTLSVYYATGATGFEVKGSGIKNFNSDSFTTTLRKPTDTLAKIMSSTPKQIGKLFETMKCKKRKANGRTNATTLLVRSLETRLS